MALRSHTQSSICAHLWAHIEAMSKTHDDTSVYYTRELMKSIPVIRDDNFKPDALAIALEELSVALDVWRVHNDPAFDPSDYEHSTSPGLERD